MYIYIYIFIHMMNICETVLLAVRLSTRSSLVDFTSVAPLAAAWPLNRLVSPPGDAGSMDELDPWWMVPGVSITWDTPKMDVLWKTP